MILLELFASFLQIGLFSIGGGYAAIPLIQSQAVEIHGWLTAEQFLDLATIAEMTPGPIGINAATFVGMQVNGVAGAAAATLGFVLPSLILASLRPAVVALIGAAGLRMFLQVGFGGQLDFGRAEWPAIALFAAALFGLRKFKMSPILIIALCGAGGLILGLLGLF